MLKEILKKIRHIEIYTNNKIDSIFLGNYRSAFKGRGIEFADIRPYDMGDDVRDIDWKTTSKQGEIFVKTYHETRDNTLFFIIDGSSYMHFSSISEHRYKRLLEAFAILAFSALKNGDRVGILFYDNSSYKIFPPKKGRKNILKILKYCVEQFETTNNLENYSRSRKSQDEIDFNKIFREVFLFLKQSSSVFWMTGEAIKLDSIAKKRLKMMRLKHDFTPIVFTDPLEISTSSTILKNMDINISDMFSKKIRKIEITDALLQNFRKIRIKKHKEFADFFKKIKSQEIFINADDNILKKIHIFFKKKQQTFI